MKFILAAACLLGAIRPTAAEPSAEIRFLMQSPVSMLDWGFKNIEDHLLRHRDVLSDSDKHLFEKGVSVSADYEWARDAIRIAVDLRLSEKLQKTPVVLTDIREHVLLIVKFLQGSLGMHPYDAFFRHKGFRDRETPENLESKLSRMTELLVTVRDKGGNILGKCRAPLVGDNIEWLMMGSRDSGERSETASKRDVPGSSPPD